MIPHKNYVKPTAFESLRMDTIKKAGCILSMLRREKGLEAPDGRTEIQHIKDTTHTLGHTYTICLDVWYHQGRPPRGVSFDEAISRFGLPLTGSRRMFNIYHGITERELWEETQRRLGMSTEWPSTKIVPRRIA